MSRRRAYREEFKREAVILTRQSGATVNQVARNIRMGSNLLSEYAVPVAARAERRSMQLTRDSTGPATEIPLAVQASPS